MISYHDVAKLGVTVGTPRSQGLPLLLKKLNKLIEKKNAEK